MEAYLDNAATTRPSPEAWAAVAAAMGEGFGNANALHRRGVAAAARIDEARAEIAEVVGGGPWKVAFTSGGSESDTLAVLGTAPRGRRKGLVTTALEHAAVSEACLVAASRGARLTVVGGGGAGVVDPEAVVAAVDEETALVSVVHVASELGTLQPVDEIARRVKERSLGALVHVDAVQALGRLARLDYAPAVDLVSLSGHKVHGPQGVGALLVRPGIEPRPLICGRDQFLGFRPGTVNLPGVLGFAAAIRRLAAWRSAGVGRLAELTGRLRDGILGGAAGVRVLGSTAVAPGFLVLAISGVQSETLLHALEARDVIVSSGSACHSRSRQPPRSLVDAGLRADEGTVRLSLSMDTTADEVEFAVARFLEALGELTRRGARR